MPAEKLWARAWPSAVRSTATMGPRPGTRTRPRRSGPKRGGGSDQVLLEPLDRGRPRPLRLLRVVARARVVVERVVHPRVPVSWCNAWFMPGYTVIWYGTPAFLSCSSIAGAVPVIVVSCCAYTAETA